MTSEDLRTYIYQHLEVLREDTKGNIYCVCPECGNDNQKFSVNVTKRVFNCWRASCRYKGKVKHLFKRFGPLRTDYEFGQTEKKNIEFEEALVTKEGYHQIWNQYFEDLGVLEGTLAEVQLKKFCEEKHLSIQELILQDVRVCRTHFEEEKWYGNFFGYLGIPYRDCFHDLVFFQYRQCPGFNVFPKWKYPKGFDDQWKADKFLWFSYPGRVSNVRIITESIFDAMRVGETAIALGGSNCSPSQLRQLSVLNPKRFYLLLDSDVPLPDGTIPGLEATKKLAELLIQYTESEILVPPLDYFGHGKDPDEMKKSELEAVFDKMMPYSQWKNF